MGTVPRSLISSMHIIITLCENLIGNRSMTGASGLFAPPVILLVALAVILFALAVILLVGHIHVSKERTQC